MKKFNTTAVCIPSRHYMVDLSERVDQIREMVDAGQYFTINRARQYGKTTTITALRNSLVDTYTVLSLDFQGISGAGFAAEEIFVQEFCRLIWNRRKAVPFIPDGIIESIRQWKESKKPEVRLGELFDRLSDWCESSERGIVLIIDEVDSAANNQVFIDFLAQLRDRYISRDTDGIATFQSVILAGVTDVKHLKLKIRSQDQHTMNNPWNIAADFDIDMSLPEEGIERMLIDYESDHHTGMDTKMIAKQLRQYTNGYPFLVSRICQLIDMEVSKRLALSEVWTQKGIDQAIKLLLAENNTLFQSLTARLNNYPELKASLRSMLMEGTNISWNPDQEDLVQMKMYGFIRNDQNVVRIDNRIFEVRLYNLFLSDEELKYNIFFRTGDLEKNIFVSNGVLNVRLIMEHFIQAWYQVYGPLEERFTEKDGRELFLLYLKPIINGTGNYYIEAQTRDQKRTDIIIDYLGKQYIIELKIWHGERYNKKGEQQISDYLDYFGLSTGYMLSFNFNKKKEIGLKPVIIGDKLLYEGTL